MDDDGKINDKPKKAPCRYCHGIGFYKGEVCSCITGAKPEIPQALKDFFGGVFMDKTRGE